MKKIKKVNIKKVKKKKLVLNQQDRFMRLIKIRREKIYIMKMEKEKISKTKKRIFILKMMIPLMNPLKKLKKLSL